MKFRKPLNAVVAVAVAVTTLAPIMIQPATARPSKGKGNAWKAFEADRTKLLERLAPAFISCFKRRDSLIDPASPIFHGCLDWHSAVHANYSHHVLYRRTGDKNYLKLAQDQIAPGGVSLIPAEYAYEQAKGADLPLSENPYGFGWFLVMTKEREVSTKKKDFREMADYAADMMISWFERRASRGDAQNYILNTAHPNYSWSLINLDLWADYTKDKRIAKAVKAAAKPLLEKSLDGLCPAAKDTEQTAAGFQPACLMRLVAAANVFGGKKAGWVKSRLPKKLEIAPLDPNGDCHNGGLNFTRAFALYELYELTGNKSYRDNYTELIRWHVDHPEFYEGEESYADDPGYMCYSHWVAQVGVRAISLSYE